MNLERYNEIRRQFGKVASWAIWNPHPKAEHDVSVIDNCIDTLHASVVMVGLNISCELDSDWSNFRGGKHDRKLKYAFNTSPFRGAYMTDIVKGNENAEVKSSKVVDDIRAVNINIADHTIRFQKEMNLVGADSETIFLVFGNEAQRLFKQYLSNHYPRFIPCPHYSKRGTDAEWVEGIWSLLEESISESPLFRRTEDMVKLLIELKSKK